MNMSEYITQNISDHSHLLSLLEYISHIMFSVCNFSTSRTMFTVNQQLASCRNVYVYAHEVPQEQDLLVDDLQLSTFRSVEPTVSPTPMPTEEDVETDIPTLSPSSVSLAFSKCY